MFNVLPWRILFIVDELDSRYQIAAGWDEAEIMTNWSYLEKESCPQLAEMENQEDQARVSIKNANFAKCQKTDTRNGSELSFNPSLPYIRQPSSWQKLTRWRGERTRKCRHKSRKS